MSLTVAITKKLHTSELDVSFSSRDGHLGLLGESGSGKSMTLKCIAGIETPDEGFIEIDGTVVYDSTRGINLSPQQRNTGYLFQNYALFPHVCAWRNIEAAVPRSLAGSVRKKKVFEYLHLFGLEGIATRMPQTISGGQQQRLALARLLASEPSLILLDEPFSALDATIKARIEEELAFRLSDFSGTVILVTHNRDEAYRFCDDLVILQNGRVVESGQKEALFAHCHTVAGARITGCANVATGLKAGPMRVAVPDWGVLLETTGTVPDGDFYVGVRSHHVRLRHKGDDTNCIDFEITGRTVSPYSVTERLVALTPAGFAGGERLVREFFIREYAYNGETVSSDLSRVTLHIPPDSVQILV
ncbi:MAG: ATP-binding cassette domain-containing protein [Spirochaetales bacterium]|nr:ATP-binding cassette domain-containing protein [Spirochaetales bacterium]